MVSDDKPLKQLYAGYEKDSIQAALQQQLRPEVPQGMTSWLGRLGLLYGVPFAYLVPDARILPTESLRFFYVDANWLEALVDGAFSIGVHSNRDIRYHSVMQAAIREATDVAAGKLRRELREELAAPDEQITVPENATRAGFLMRSALVAGWPGLEVSGYRQTGESSDLLYKEKHYQKIEMLRLERLSPSVMLCIFAQIPDLVVLNEPAEDFHFGVNAGTAEANRVVDIVALQQEVGPAAGSAKLAVELIDAPDRWFFDPQIGAI